MDQTLDDLLCSKYPKMFVNRNKSMTETCMCWGFTCGSGWFNIIDQLCSNIQWHIDSSVKDNKRDVDFNLMILALQAGDSTRFLDWHKDYKKSEHIDQRRQELLKAKPRQENQIVPQVTVDQVKEKFGTLRFYYSGGDDVIYGMVRMAESMTEVTCEECANPAETRGNGWVYTLCDPCVEKRDAARSAAEAEYKQKKED